MSFLIPFCAITRALCSSSPSYPLLNDEWRVIGDHSFSWCHVQGTKYPFPLQSRYLILVMRSADSTVNALSNDRRSSFFQKLTELPMMGIRLRTTWSAVDQRLFWATNLLGWVALTKLRGREGGAGAECAIFPSVGHLQLISILKIGADCCILCQYKLTKPYLT